jgi:hypothetical protein
MELPKELLSASLLAMDWALELVLESVLALELESGSVLALLRR